jgi:hypothetical protein
MASNERIVVNNELERTWMEAVMAYFKVLSRYLPGGTEENYKNSVRIAGFRAEI